MDELNQSILDYLKATRDGQDSEDYYFSILDSDKEKFTNILYDLFKDPYFDYDRFNINEITSEDLYLSNGNSWFVYGIINYYQTGYKKPDYKAALYEFKEAAKKGNQEAMVYLSKMYLEGMGTEKNVEESLKWTEKSANLGNPIGLYRLGSYYENGIGVNKDMTKAKEYYKKSCDKGLKNGCEKLK